MEQLKILTGDIMRLEQSPTEYFKDLVESAIDHQHLEADEMVRFYLVQLLVNSIESAKVYTDDEPLAIAFGKAFQTGLVKQGMILRQIGDFSLYLSGFFSESLSRKLVDVDYYISIGKMSYNYLSDIETSFKSRNSFSSLYKELSIKFLPLTDVLAEVSERCRLTSNENTLRLYEKWIKTKTEWSAKILREQGIEPLQELHCNPIH